LSFFPLSRYIKQSCPDGIISALSHANCAVLLARKINNNKIKTNVVVSERNISFQNTTNKIGFKRIALNFLIKYLYPDAKCIITVSKGVRESIINTYKFKRNQVKCIYNPIDLKKINKLKSKNFLNSAIIDELKTENQKIILSVGSLTPQKNYSLLIKAFKIVREKINCKLIILGEGPERSKLDELCRNLEIDSKSICLPGFIANPFPYMKACDLYVLSSLWEGLPNVLIQALACECRIVSTDCDAGPREILEDGKWGRLTKVNDINELADAMIEQLNKKNQNYSNSRKGRLNRFNVADVTDQYLEALEL
jgi:glycosyltransferase involved in cell wall biosynthesis